MSPTTPVKTKIILLLFIPIVNRFNFPPSTEKLGFFDLAETRKRLLSSQKTLSLSKEELLNLVEADYNITLLKLNVNFFSLVL